MASAKTSAFNPGATLAMVVLAVSVMMALVVTRVNVAYRGKAWHSAAKNTLDQKLNIEVV